MLKLKKNLKKFLDRPFRIIPGLGIGTMFRHSCRHAFNRGSLPDFMVIGTQKGGTSSLHYYLQQHTNISQPLVKETHFFSEGYEKRNLSWYKSFFNSDSRLNYEITPIYFFHPLVPRRIIENMDINKFILVLRDPIDRAFSHYQMSVIKGFESLSFQEALDQEESRISNFLDDIENNIFIQKNYNSYCYYSYKNRGKYYEQLRNWLQFYELDNFLILGSGDLRDNTIDSLGKISTFLGLPPFSSNIDITQKHQGRSNDEMSIENRELLEKYFFEANDRLNKLLGRKINR